MSYDNTGLRNVVPGLGAGPAIWLYTTADAHAAVDAAGYFSDGATFGLAANDVMFVIDTNVPMVSVHHVLNATSISSAVFS